MPSRSSKWREEHVHKSVKACQTCPKSCWLLIQRMSALTAAATISYSEFLEKQPALPSSYYDLLPGWHAPEWSRVAYILYVSSTIVREIPVLCRLVSSVSFSEDAGLILCKLLQRLPWGATNFFVKTKWQNLLIRTFFCRILTDFLYQYATP